MADINITVPHELSFNEALGRIQVMLGYLVQKYRESIDALDSEWDGATCTFTLAARGKTLSGSIVVYAKEVTRRVGLPSGASLFRKKIQAFEDMIRSEAEEVLSA